MMTQKVIAQRPKNGCARCVWWMQHSRDNYGRCAILRVKTWWKHAPCVEYELDTQVPDEIRIVAGDV